MAVSTLFIRVEVEHDPEDTPEALAREVCRQISKVYGVRTAELSSFVSSREE